MDGNLQKFKLSFGDDLKNTFKYTINTNILLKRDIEEIYERFLINSGKSILSRFHLRYILMFEELAKQNNLSEFSEDLHSNINLYFEYLNHSLFIKKKADLEELEYILNFSLIMLEAVIEDNDIGLAYESFFQVERRIKKSGLSNRFDYCSYHGDDCEFVIGIDPPNNPVVYDNKFVEFKFETQEGENEV